MLYFLTFCIFTCCFEYQMILHIKHMVNSQNMMHFNRLNNQTLCLIFDFSQLAQTLCADEDCEKKWTLI